MSLEEIMATIAIAYATRDGHTAKVARHLATAMRRAGHQVQVLDADRRPRVPDHEGIDAVVVAAPIRAGGYPRSIVRFVRAHVLRLIGIPSAFCSIGLAVASRTTDGRAQTQPIVDAFQRKTGWRPDRTELIAGALPYTKYNFVVRFMMRRIAAANGGDVDTSRDYEYTDWDALDRFAAEMCRDAAQHAAARIVPADLAVAGPWLSRT
jgi:menaquinone-dependent protoporphyrinogen oxidase